jgi:hypothetical protein
MMSAVEFCDFSLEALINALGLGVTTDYLGNYLLDLGATAVLREPHYVDRHYLDEYANYYSRSFRPPAVHCSRLHFFAGWTAEELRQQFVDAISGSDRRWDVERQLTDNYLGFIVRRPLTGAPVGRTVLRTYPADGRRHFEVARVYSVHLAGLKLTVNGLAFQNQDRGAAVCASTALWSSLQSVARVSGNRTPTPNAITAAAGSPFPATDGLSAFAMATALRKLGYIADLFGPSGNHDWFRALLVACLDSGLPVVLLLVGNGIGHAVAVTGYSEPENVKQMRTPGNGVIPMLSAGLSIVYVHDDNLGPHAHYKLLDVADSNNAPQLVLERGNAQNPRPTSWKVDRLTVVAALVPKPEKLRLSVPDLLKNSVVFQHFLSFVQPSVFDVKRLNYGARFDSGIEVKSRIAGGHFEDESRQAFLLGTNLPRHVGVLTASDDGAPFCDLIMDVTEVDRLPGVPSLLAVIAHAVPKDHPLGRLLGRLAQTLEIPIVYRRA